jgi:serine/threonine protein kinase
MQCAVCGHKNADGALNCSSCGVLPGRSTPVSSTVGIATGGTSGVESQNGVYSSHLNKGIRLQGEKYVLGEVLGQGGFGITYKGGDLSLRRYVAIKEFFPPSCVRQGLAVTPAGTLSVADYNSIKAKFIEEARTLARFSDPGIVRVFGVFEENNTAYMVMEFLEGKTLAKMLKEKGSLPEKEMLTYAQALGEALVTIHEANLIHRDIKPDNIVVTTKGRVVLIDFGTARQFTSGKTVRQTALLTADYAPLEQYSNQARFGAYSDIYALGATLYHCLTGQVPPQATDRAAGVELKPPDQLNPYISPAVSDAVQWALKVQTSARPQNIREFLHALQGSLPNASPQPTFDVLNELQSWQPVVTPSASINPPALPLNPPPVTPLPVKSQPVVQDEDRKAAINQATMTCGSLGGFIGWGLDVLGLHMGTIGIFSTLSAIGFCIGAVVGWVIVSSET